MSNTTLILLGAGNSTRFQSDVKKQWLTIGDIPLWLYVAEKFEKSALFEKVIIVSSQAEIEYMQHFADYDYVVGGDCRQASLNHGLQEVESEYVLVSDIARCCVPEVMIKRILDAKEKGSCIVPVLPVVDTLYLNGSPIDREQTKIIQTPQLSVTKLLKKALQTDKMFTDDSSAIASLGEKVYFVKGSTKAHKLTTLEDLQKLPCLQPPSSKVLTGFGIDTHPFERDKQMVLCGVPIASEYGFKAHSDGDVAIHALIDALLGAVGMGDIGELYPDNDTSYKDIDSKILLQDCVKRIHCFGYTIHNIDMTMVIQSPKIAPYKAQMRSTLASILKIRKNLVNIKATTAEKLGFIGRNEGVTVHCVATLGYISWETL